MLLSGLAPAIGVGFLLGRLVDGRPRFKWDFVIVYLRQKKRASGNGPHRHRDLLGVSWGGICDCQVLPRSRVVGGGVLGGAGDSQHRPGPCGLMSKKRGCSLGTPAFDESPLHRKKLPKDGLDSRGWSSLSRQNSSGVRDPRKKSRPLRTLPQR